MDIDVKNFESEVLNSDKLVLIDFWAEWCMPCRMLAPTIENLSKRDDCKVYKINCDDNQLLPKQYNIRSIPTVLFFKGGEVVHSLTGIHSENEFIQAINQWK